MMPPIRTLLSGCALLSLSSLSTALPFQDGKPQGALPGTVDAERLLDERRRDETHPGDPLNVMGVFQGDNNLVKGKGALGRSTYEPKMIDQEEAYERQLAMFEKRGHYHYAYAPAFNGDEEMPVMQPAAKAPVKKEEPAGSSTDAWIAALSVAALASLALMYQSRN